MRRRDHVHAEIGDRPGEREHEKRAAIAKCDARQARCGEHAPARNERPSAVPWGVAPIAPPPDQERHGEARRRVHHHGQPDQRRRIPDLREQQREVGRRHRSHETGADCGGSEDEQVSEAAPRTERGGRTLGSRVATSGSLETAHLERAGPWLPRPFAAEPRTQGRRNERTSRPRAHREPTHPRWLRARQGTPGVDIPSQRRPHSAGRGRLERKGAPYGPSPRATISSVMLTRLDRSARSGPAGLEQPSSPRVFRRRILLAST